MKVFCVFELVRMVHLDAQRSGESAFALNKCGKALYGDNLGVFYANDLNEVHAAAHLELLQIH